MDEETLHPTLQPSGRASEGKVGGSSTAKGKWEGGMKVGRGDVYRRC